VWLSMDGYLDLEVKEGGRAAKLFEGGYWFSEEFKEGGRSARYLNSEGLKGGESSVRLFWDG
jgi:hypothetical protein